MARKATGKVTVQSLRDRLRLTWSYAGERFFLYLGLPDIRVNRMVAEGKARQIEADMATGNFDATLRKYKDEQQSLARISVVDLFSRFLDWKSKRVYASTMVKYKACSYHLNQFFPKRLADSITEKDVDKFRKYFSEQDPSTIKTYFGFLKACWDWAIAQKILDGHNPWGDIVIKVPPKQRPQPLKKSEVQAVLEAFRTHQNYKHYADFVEFMLGTGVRTGEAIGLRWCHVSEDCKQVWIGEVISRGGVRKATKTNRDRTLILTPKLQAMLQRRKAESAGELVFPAPKGGAIDDHNFRNRAWVKVLEFAGIPYRKPYITRSTMISHALAQGGNPVEIAELTGHDVEVLYKNYAGVIESTPRLPDLWD
jgi:integrase